MKMPDKEEFNFIQERIKQKPYNRKKILRKMVITVSLAVVFGLVSCFTFMILGSVFNYGVYPEEGTVMFRFPQEEDEITLEDIVTSDEELQTQMRANLEELEIMAEAAFFMLEEVNQINNYQLLYQELYNVAEETKRSIVTIESVVSDVDWFDNQYEQKGRTSGFIVANNGEELIIIAHYNEMLNRNDIRITFCDDTQVTASVKQIDTQLQLIALAVSLNNVPDETIEEIQEASLGISMSSKIIATPVIALGSPIGVQNSLVYGMVTSAGNIISIPDNTYQYFTTDMQGNINASGVIIDLDGKILGIIAQQYTQSGEETSLRAIGITELKNTIEKITNGQEMPYLGVYPVDVPNTIHEVQNIPYGAYVSRVEMDSPAMLQGIQSGDIIVEIDGIDIYNSSDYVGELMKKEKGSSINVKFMRQSVSLYKEMTVRIGI